MFIPKGLAALVLFASGVVYTNAACNKNCNGHGTCGAYDKCTCHYKWRHPLAEDCSMRVCPYGQTTGVYGETDPHTYKECSNQGICNRESGECECYEGFTGSACQRAKCPNDCSGHGQCQVLSTLNSNYATTNWDADQQMICKCDPGYQGPGCELRSCPLGDDPLTKYMAASGSGEQTDDIQTCTITDSGSADIQTKEFAIQFTDWTGQVHTTAPLPGSATALQIKEALQALPNNVIPSITVTLDGTNDPANGLVKFLVTFTSSDNAGQQTTLTLVTDAHATQGSQPMIAGSLTAGSTAVCTHNSVTYYEESKVCAGRGICDHETGMCSCHVGFYGHSCDKQTALQ